MRIPQLHVCCNSRIIYNDLNQFKTINLYALHKCQHYCFRVGNPAFRAPSRTVKRSVKISRFCFEYFALIVCTMYIFFIILGVLPVCIDLPGRRISPG